MWGSSLANAALFALFFPAVRLAPLHLDFTPTHPSTQYIIMAMHARPVPLDPYNPSRGGGGADDGGVRYPAPLLPIRVPVFAPVLFLNDWIVRVLSVGTAVGRAGAGGHRRVLSDSVESIEEGGAGDGVEGVRGALGASRARMRPGGAGGRLGRKYD